MDAKLPGPALQGQPPRSGRAGYVNRAYVLPCSGGVSAERYHGNRSFARAPSHAGPGEKTLRSALDSACAADIDDADTAELIRIEEVLAIANEAAKKVVSGWLAFDSGMETRRVAPIPDDWETASDEALIELCERADVAPRRTRSAPAEPRHDRQLPG